jgi:hypothetical protein
MSKVFPLIHSDPRSGTRMPLGARFGPSTRDLIGIGRIAAAPPLIIDAIRPHA